ncbi:unnamed protein product [Camellia sinensis]
MQVIWDWILIEKLHIPHSERNMFSAILVVPETFDNRGDPNLAGPSQSCTGAFIGSTSQPELRGPSPALGQLNVPKLGNIQYFTSCRGTYMPCIHTSSYCCNSCHILHIFDYGTIDCKVTVLQYNLKMPYILSRNWVCCIDMRIMVVSSSKQAIVISINQIKEMLSIVLRDLHFSSAVVHQEGLAAVFGNGLSTACVVNMGAQVTSVICIEDGVALPTTQMTLRFGGEDISRCLLWTQRHHQTWPPIRTDALTKPVDLLMLNRLKEMYCQIKEGEVEAVAVVHSYEDGMPAGSHKTRLTALNVPPMGLFYPMLLVPDVHPPPPRFWFNDYEDMLEDAWHMEFPRRSDMSDGLYSSLNSGFPMWDSYSFFQTKPKKEDCIGLAEAITKSILSTGFGGVALTAGLISAAEERVLHAIPSNEAIDTVEVLQSRTNPTFVSWKGGAILGVLDFGRDAWIHREDWIRSGIHIGSGRKYKDSYFLQAQAMCYMNS